MAVFAGSAFTVVTGVVEQSHRECNIWLCWSVGVIVYFLFTQKIPLNAKSEKEIFQKISKILLDVVHLSFHTIIMLSFSP